MKIFAMDDYKRTINSNAYKKASMNYKFNMLENRLVDFGSVYNHIVWTDDKIKKWQLECPKENSSNQFNCWLENKFKYLEKCLGL